MKILIQVINGTAAQIWFFACVASPLCPILAEAPAFTDGQDQREVDYAARGDVDHIAGSNTEFLAQRLDLAYDFGSTRNKTVF